LFENSDEELGLAEQKKPTASMPAMIKGFPILLIYFFIIIFTAGNSKTTSKTTRKGLQTHSVRLLVVLCKKAKHNTEERKNDCSTVVF
jgi:hypothetical protein